MFRLCKQISGHLISAGTVISDDKHFAWTCKGIDPDLSINRLLGQGHVEISGSADHIHGWNTFTSVCHGGDRLCSTDSENGFHAGEMRRCENHRTDCSVPTGRRADDHLGYTGHPGRYGIHQDGAGVGSASSGDVETSALHRSPASSDVFTVRPDHGKVCRSLTLVKVSDAPMGKIQGVTQIHRQSCARCFELLQRNGDGVGSESIESLRELLDCCIPSLSDGREDGIDTIPGLTLLSIACPAREASEFLDGLCLIPHDAQECNRRWALGQGNDRSLMSS